MRGRRDGIEAADNDGLDGGLVGLVVNGGIVIVDGGCGGSSSSGSVCASFGVGKVGG